MVAVAFGAAFIGGFGATQANAECGDYVIYRGAPWLNEHGAVDFQLLEDWMERFANEQEQQAHSSDRQWGPFGIHDESPNRSKPCHGPNCGQGKSDRSVPPLATSVRPSKDTSSWFVGSEREWPGLGEFSPLHWAEVGDCTSGFPFSIERPPRAVSS